MSGPVSHYPYRPSHREYADTILAFNDFRDSAWSARISPDPLGPVNKIVSLMRGDRVMAKALTHVPAGAKVALVRDSGGYGIDEVFALRSAFWDSRGAGKPPPETPFPRPPGWRIKINGRTVLAVTDRELAPPRPPAPKQPLRQRIIQDLREQWRHDCDTVAAKLGYHRAEKCTGWDD